MYVKAPKAILEKPVGCLLAISTESEVTLFVREDEWGLKKYPSRCQTELRLGTWDIDDVLLNVLLLRLGASDLGTFECWVNAAEPLGVRTLQCLAAQAKVNTYLVIDRVVRSFRLANRLQAAADRLVSVVRLRKTWTEEEFQLAQTRLAELYPTPHALWWNCPQPRRR